MNSQDKKVLAIGVTAALASHLYLHLKKAKKENISFLGMNTDNALKFTAAVFLVGGSILVYQNVKLA